MNSCPICLETITSTKASPDICNHLFCLQCLTKWSKMESFCPVDRKRFRKIINLDTGTSCEVKRGGKKRKAPTLYDVSAFCEVCKSGEKDDTLLLCDSCDLAYHCECLSPPLGTVPSGRWFCPICSSVDRRLEHGEELSKKLREDSSQPFFQTSSYSYSTQASLEAAKSCSVNFTTHPFNLRKTSNKGHSSGSLSFPSTSSSGQVKRGGNKRKAPTWYDTAFCKVCNSGEKDDTLLLCDSCDLAYHCECLSPPLSTVPSGRWFCPICSSVDRRLEHGEELSKKPREDSSQPCFQTSSYSYSTQASLEAAKSCSVNFTTHPFNLRKTSNKGHSSGSLSFPSTSSSGQLNSVKISKEDYQTLCAHSKSLFLAPGITVSPDRRTVPEFTVKTTPLVSLPNESRKIVPSACDSSEHLMSNSAVKLGISNFPESDLKNKGRNQNSRTSETSDIIYESAVSQLKGKGTFTAKSSKPSNLITSCSDSDKYEKHSKNQLSNVIGTFTSKSSKTSNLITSCSDSDKYEIHSKNQLSNVSVLKTLLIPRKEDQDLEPFEGFLNVPNKIRDSDDSSDCEIVFDSSNCITISDDLSSGEFEQISKISSVTSQAEQNSMEISSDNQSVALSRPATPNSGCLKDGSVIEAIIDHVTETEEQISKISVTSQVEQNSMEISSDNQSVALSRLATPNSGCLKDGSVIEAIIDHVSETEDEDDLLNPLDDFEIRRSYYAAKAKMNLPRELKKIEEEYRKQLTHKRAKTSTGASSNLLEVPQTKKQELESLSAPDSKKMFNIIDYTRRVKKGKHLHTSYEILNKCKAFVAFRNAEKSKPKPNFESGHNLNVFQGPFSQYSFVHGGTKMRFMHFDPSDIPKEDATSNQFLKTYPKMLHRDFQDLSMREDGSLFLNWSMKC